MENILGHVEMVLAKLELRETSMLASGGMDYVREELDYEYDASVEFDMPLDHYGE